MRRGPLRRLPELTLALAVCALLGTTLLGEHPGVRAGSVPGEPPVPAPSGSLPTDAALRPAPVPGGPVALRGPVAEDGGRRASAGVPSPPGDPRPTGPLAPTRPASEEADDDRDPTRDGPALLAEVHEAAGVGRGGLRGRERHGPWTWHRPDGSLALEGAYVDGRREGTWTWYGPDGHATCVGAYRADERQGAWVDLARDGAVLLERHYRAGVLDGPWERNFTDGSPRERGTYVQGLREGAWHYYLPGGRVDLRTGHYEHGRKQPPPDPGP